MDARQSTGGIAALVAAGTFVFGFALIAAGMVGNIGLGRVVDVYGDDASQAAALWSAVDAVQNGLGGGNEIVGGLWVLLVGATALQMASLPRAANYLGLVAGAAELVTVVPGLEDVGAVFGLGLIVWFAWVGSIMVRNTATGAASPARPVEAHR